ncbi:mas-related G-protein coupled receptor member D-like [Apus apus]|uniref:mas-related G-protein coupled receptor member D-like n=1 Tax=Apus apus TaxID=8895 RepID=UPI0021F89344|nr:mas-related G-protein coupled receptor member D-like [Apus apus]
MEEPNTTDLSLNNSTDGYVDYGENIEHECFSLPYGLMVFTGVCMGISLCGLVGNGIVVWFLGFHMKQNPFTIYALNLAVADFSLLLLYFLLILAVLTVAAACPYLYSFISYYRDFAFAVEFLCHFFDLSSLGLLTAISVEQCISVLFPIWHRCHRPKHFSGAVSGVLWALAGILVSSRYLSLNVAESDETVFTDVTMVVSMMLSLVMLISDLSLFMKLRCGSQRCQQGQRSISVLLSGIFFLALGISFGVEVFLNLASSLELFPENFLLDLLNCSVAPVVYFLVGICQQCRLQGSMKSTFRRVFDETVMSAEDSHVPEDTVAETTV